MTVAQANVQTGVKAQAFAQTFLDAPTAGLVSVALDVRTMHCPMPLLKLKLQLKSMHCGEHVLLVASDVGSKQDIPKYIAMTSHTLISKIETEQGDFVFVVNVQNN